MIMRQHVCCMSTENTLVTDDTELDLKKRLIMIIIKNLEKVFTNEAPSLCQMLRPRKSRWQK